MDKLNDVNVVVFRSLMTGLSKEAYEAVFDCFFAELAEASDRIRGGNPGKGCIKVPYKRMSESNEARTMTVSSINPDLDAAEALGYCEAMSRAAGGSVETHMENGMIGCSVHLDRDVRRRSRKAEVLHASGIKSMQLLQKFTRFRKAEDEETASAALDEIREFDGQWVQGAKSSKPEPMICQAKSKMPSASHTLGYFDTYGVDAHNRRGNLLIGTHNSPQEAAERLAELDLKDLKDLKKGKHERFSLAHSLRICRADSALLPSTIRNTGFVR